LIVIRRGFIAAALAKPGPEVLENSIGIRLKLLPAGTFAVGHPRGRHRRDAASGDALEALLHGRIRGDDRPMEAGDGE
jgi:hypothetical protein